MRYQKISWVLFYTASLTASLPVSAETLRYFGRNASVEMESYQQRRVELQEKKWVNRQIRDAGIPPPTTSRIIAPEGERRAPLSVQVPPVMPENQVTQADPALAVQVIDVQLGSGAKAAQANPRPMPKKKALPLPRVPAPPESMPPSMLAEQKPKESEAKRAYASAPRAAKRNATLSAVLEPVAWLADRALEVEEGVADFIGDAFDIAQESSAPSLPRQVAPMTPKPALHGYAGKKAGAADASPQVVAGSVAVSTIDPLGREDAAMVASAVPGAPSYPLPAMPAMAAENPSGVSPVAVAGQVAVSTINPVEALPTTPGQASMPQTETVPQNALVSPDPLFIVKRASVDGTVSTETTNRPPAALAMLAPASGSEADLPTSPANPPSALQPDPAALAASSPVAVADAVIAGAPKPVLAPPADEPTEPAPTLSAQSQQILKTIPAGVGGDPASVRPQKIDVNRQAAVEEVFSPTKDAQHSHEAIGIKIDVRKPAYDANYELEKAYNALVTGQSDAAIATYQNILANDANNVQALFGLATAYHRAGQTEKARPLYGRVLKSDPRHEGAINNFLMLIAEEAPDEALSELARLQERNPRLSTIPAQMAGIFQKKADYASALDAMMRAVDLAPENITYRYNLAILFDRLNKRSEAMALYQQLVEAQMRGEILPHSAQVQERLTFLRSNSR